MIGAEIKSQEKRRAGASAKYAAGENEQEKILATGFGNCFAETFAEAAEEMDADDRAYSGDGDNVSHWVFSFHSDETVTPEQFQEFVEKFMHDQGMGDHKYAWGLHKNTENLHGHLTFLRTKPQSEPDGSYKIQNFGGRVAWKNGTNNRYECSRATIIDFCKKYGLKDDFTEIAARPSDPNAIRLSQEIRNGEAQTGKPHPKRIMGEAGRDAIRAALAVDKPTMDLIHAGLSRRGLGLAVREDGKGASIIGPQGEKIPLSCLPPDCSLKNIRGKTGEIRSAEPPKTPAGQGFYADKISIGKVKSFARAAIKNGASWDQIENNLAARQMRIERYGKSGAYLAYGPGPEDKMKMSALGGKFSISAINKRINANSSLMRLMCMKVK